MLTEILSPSRFTTFEKIPAKIFPAFDAPAAVAREIAGLILSKQKIMKLPFWGFATSTPKKVLQNMQ